MLPGFEGRRTSDSPDSFLSNILGSLIPPTGPNAADFILENIWGEEVECFKARRCKIGGIPGEGGTSMAGLCKSWLLVFRLSILGLRFMAGIWGLIKADGDEGSETRAVVVVRIVPGG